MDNTFIASCCASAYPEPVIRINEVAVPIVYGNHTDGVYQGCASRSIPTSGVVAGSNLTTNCSVSLKQRIACTTTGTGGEQVPQQVINNCNAALSANVSVSATTLVVGK